MTNKFNIQNILVYITAFLLVLSNVTMYTTIEGEDSLASYIIYLPFITLGAILFLRGRLKVDRAFPILVYLMIYLIVSGSFNCTSLELRTTLLTLIVVIFLIVYVDSYEGNGQYQMYEAYTNIMFFLAFGSLVIWLMGPVFHIISPLFTFYSNWGYDGVRHGLNLTSNYYFICLSQENVDFLGLSLSANNCIFVEKSFTAFSFCTGLFYEMYVRENPSRLRIIVFIAAILSTCSTTGVIMATISAVFYYVSKMSNRSNTQLFLILLFPIIAYFAYDFLSGILEEKALTHSGESRGSDFQNGILGWHNSPIWGYGFNNSKKLIEYSTGYSNSIALILMKGGLMLAFLYISPFIKCISKGVRTKQLRFILFSCSLFVVFSFTIVAMHNNIFYFLLFMTKWASDNMISNNSKSIYYE